MSSFALVAIRKTWIVVTDRKNELLMDLGHGIGLELGIGWVVGLGLDGRAISLICDLYGSSSALLLNLRRH